MVSGIKESNSNGSSGAMRRLNWEPTVARLNFDRLIHVDSLTGSATFSDSFCSFHVFDAKCGDTLCLNDSLSARMSMLFLAEKNL